MATKTTKRKTKPPVEGQGRMIFMEREAPVATRMVAELPSLNGLKELAFDTETTTEDLLFDRSLSGISYRTPDGRKGYIPIRHPGGGNFGIDNVRDWARGELRGKMLIVANAKHEQHTMRKFGADPEELGCSWMDVFHQAPLLNEKRRRTNLHLLAEEELDLKMIEADHAKIWEMPAEDAAVIATEDADVTWRLYEAYKPRIEAEGLGKVLALENDLVFSTCEMEKNGSYLDIPLLLQWERETKHELEARTMRVQRETGLLVDFGTNAGMSKLFGYLGVENHHRTESGEEQSFGEDVMLEFIGRHPLIMAALEARQLLSLRSKYILKYLATARHDGWVCYSLHQLRGDDGGTVTGRYSSSMVNKDKKIGINIQQVSKTKKMPKFLQRWPIRKLFVTPPGETYLSSDASQIEYRLFAHYASLCRSKYTGEPMTRIAEEYVRNPKVDFHALVQEWTGLIRDHAKNVNFCKLYGGGAEKIALMINMTRPSGAPKVTEAWVKYNVLRPYDHKFPEAKELMALTEKRARDAGFVRTLLDRRRRYNINDRFERFYSAMNAVLQGSAADLAKLKIKHLYAERKRLGITLRSTVHDEVNGTVPSPECSGPIAKFMNEQELKLNVPILWETGTGPNWEEAK